MLPRLFLTVFLSLKCAAFPICDDNADCQDGYSCIENTCKICVECSLIFRRGNKCESDFNDCGDCLEGYKEISVTDNSAVKKPCKPIKKTGNLKECATDDNCPPDNYCSEKSCVNCFDCSLLNRLKPEKCAREPNECGPCFIGYLSIHSKNKGNYSKCEKVPLDHVPYSITLGSTSTAYLLIVVFGVAALVALAVFHIKRLRGLESSETISQTSGGQNYPPSAPPYFIGECSQSVKLCLEGSPIVRNERQVLQHARVFRWPCAPYYPRDVSEPDAGPTTVSSNVPDQPVSAQREDAISSNGGAIHGECARSGSLSEVNSINSHSDSQDEQPVDINILNNESGENSSHLLTENPSQVPEEPVMEPSEDLPLCQ